MSWFSSSEKAQKIKALYELVHSAVVDDTAESSQFLEILKEFNSIDTQTLSVTFFDVISLIDTEIHDSRKPKLHEILTLSIKSTVVSLEVKTVTWFLPPLAPLLSLTPLKKKNALKYLPIDIVEKSKILASFEDYKRRFIRVYKLK